MLEISQIHFNDEMESNGSVRVEDVVICHLSPTDVVCGPITEAMKDPVKHIIPAQEAINMQVFVAKRLGIPYKCDKDALQDYLSVHWAWCELRAHSVAEAITDIIRKPDVPTI